MILKQKDLSFADIKTMSIPELMEVSDVFTGDLKESIKAIDTKKRHSGVYLLYTKCDTLLYVGQSVRVKDRLNTHLNGKDNNTWSYIDHVAYIRVIFTYWHKELEDRLIRELKPMFNSGKGSCSSQVSYGYKSFYEKRFEARNNFDELLYAWKELRKEDDNITQTPTHGTKGGKKMEIKLSDVLPYLNKSAKMEFVINQIIANATEVFGEEDGGVISEILSDVLSEISETKRKISVA
jgi:predicted GIY-YIG superfamily endonuclease